MNLNNKGFSLVELLGVIVLIGIVFGIVSVSYANPVRQFNKAYYQNLENSLLVAGNSYFTYNKYNQNEEVRVSLDTLISKKYIDIVVDEKHNKCDLVNSYVAVYKSNSFVCLICNDYVSNNDKCFK